MWWAQLLNTITAILDAGAGGGGGAYESIASFTADGTAATYTFTSIPATYKHLQIRSIGRHAAAISGSTTTFLRFNSDTSGSYDYHFLRGDGSAVQAYGYANNSSTEIYNSLIYNSSTAGAYGAAIIDIHDYSSTTKNKTVKYFSGSDANTASSSFQVVIGSSLWRNTAAISGIQIYTGGANFVSGSTFALYGIKGE
jgi:hypothetical protein